MPIQPQSPRSDAGFTMVELLIAMVMLAALSAATFSVFGSQSKSFRTNTSRFDLSQNMRSAIELTERTTRTMGAGVVGQQPTLVYGGNDILAFNADYIERDTVNLRWAAYWNPDAPAAEAAAWDAATATTLPNTSYTYPATTFRLSSGSLSPAETYILYLEQDAATTRSDDFILFQRVNAGTPEMLARNLLAPTGGRPWFQYLLQRTLVTGDTLINAAGGLLPLIRRPAASATNAADSANFVRPDSVRAVRFRFRVTNGQTGAEQSIREVETLIEVPNNGIPMPTVCGRSPLPPATLGLIDSGLGDGRVTVSWTASPDQTIGEVDVRQYILWRRLASAPAFEQPLLVVRAEAGTPTYTSAILDNLPGTAYVFGIAAQDCTPNLSTTLTSNITTSTP